jgi:hypothetical protein
MAKLRVRYRNGETDEWELHERMDLKRLGGQLTKAMDGSIALRFGTASETGAPSDYATVALRMSDIIMWTIDGFVDDAALIGAWAEMDSTPLEGT